MTFEVPKTPLDGLPTLEHRNYWLVWRSVTLDGVDHPEFMLMRFDGDYDKLMLRDHFELFVVEAISDATKASKFIVLPHLTGSAIGSVHDTLAAAMEILIGWRDRGVIQAISDQLPSEAEVNERLHKLFFQGGGEPYITSVDFNWAGEIKPSGE